MSSRHPLDPLTADEIRTAVAIVTSERGVTDRWRFASIDLREPSKTVLANTEAAPPREAEVVCWNRDDGNAYKGRRVAHRQARRGLGAATRRAAADDARRVPRMRRDAPPRPPHNRRARPARRHRHGARAVRHLGLRRRARPRALPRPADRLDRRLASELPRGEPVREHGRRAAPGRRPQHDGAARARGRRPRPAAEDHGRVRPGARPRPRATRGRPARSTSPSPPARRSRSTATSSAGRSGRCGSGSTSARAS